MTRPTCEVIKIDEWRARCALLRMITMFNSLDSKTVSRITKEFLEHQPKEPE